MTGRYLIVAACLLSASCFPVTPPQEIVPEDVRFQAPPDRVWQALTLVYTDLGLPIENIDRSSWFMRSDQMVQPPSAGNSDLFDCGTTEASYPNEIAQATTIRASITTLLIPEGDETLVRNRVNANGSRSAAGLMGSPVEVTCYSTGELERRVIEALQARIR